MATFGELQAQLRQVQQEIDALKKRGSRPARIPRALVQKLHALQAQLVGCTATDVYRGDDGGAYYVRQIGGAFRWFGERADGAFANVFIGQRAADTVFGRWFDVPKGDRAGGGDLTLTVDDAAGTIAVVSQTGGFGATRFTLDHPCGADAVPRADMARRRARYQTDPAIGLTGTWMSDDFFFYVRQIGSQVGWVAESSFEVYVFDGVLSDGGTRLDGSWASVPKVGPTESGRAVLALDRGSGVQGPRMQLIEGTLPVQPRPRPPLLLVIDRMEALDVVVHLDAFELLHGFPQRVVFVPTPPFELVLPGGFQAGHFELRPEPSGDEPYLWTVFATIDGPVVRAERLVLSGTVGVVSNSGSQHNLTPRDDLPAGTVLPIPPKVGRFETTLFTIRGLPTSLAKKFTTLITGVVALEQEDIENSAMEHGRLALVAHLSLALSDAVRSGKAPDIDQLAAELQRVARSAVGDAVSAAHKALLAIGFELEDTVVGENHDVRTFADLENAVRKESPDTLTLSLPLLFNFPPPPEADPSYFVSGQIDVVASPNLLRHIPEGAVTTTTTLTP